MLIMFRRFALMHCVTDLFLTIYCADVIFFLGLTILRGCNSLGLTILRGVGPLLVEANVGRWQGQDFCTLCDMAYGYNAVQVLQSIALVALLISIQITILIVMHSGALTIVTFIVLILKPICLDLDFYLKEFTVQYNTVPYNTFRIFF